MTEGYFGQVGNKVAKGFRDPGEEAKRAGGYVARQSKGSGASQAAANADFMDLSGNKGEQTKADNEAKASAQDAAIAVARANKPKFGSAFGPDDQLKDQYKLKHQGSNLGAFGDRMDGAQAIGETSQFGKANSAVDAMGVEGNAVGPSKWAQAREGEVDAQAMQARNAAAEESNRGAASGMSRMASMGGLGGGSAERMNMAAGRDQLKASQGIYAGANTAKLGIGAQDEQTKAGMRAGLAGAYGALDQSAQNRMAGNNELAMGKAKAWGQMAEDEAKANAAVDAGNVQTGLGDLAGGNDYNTRGYGEDMAVLGAKYTADAQLQTNPKKLY